MSAVVAKKKDSLARVQNLIRIKKTTLQEFENATFRVLFIRQFLLVP